MSKKYGVPTLAVVLSALVVLSLAVSPAGATKSLYPQFKAKYVVSGSKKAKDVAFAAAVEKTNCKICHQGKKGLNDYGKAVKKYVSKRDSKDTARVRTGLEKAAATHSKPSDSKSPTFGEMFAKGKLPGAK